MELIGYLRLNGRTIALGACSALALVLAAGAALAVPPTHAATLSCGDIVYQNTVLENDVLGCQGPGIGIAADGVTFDLNGHTIAGGRLEFGIFPLGRLRDVTIENGTVIGFRYGVSLPFVSRPIVRRMTLTGGHDGILTLGSVDSVIEHNVAYGNDGSGIFASATTRERFEDNLLVQNAAGFTGTEVVGAFLARNSVLRNTFNGVQFLDATGVRFERNRSSGNGGFGFSLEGESSGNAFLRNVADANGSDGFLLTDDSSGSILERNAADRNRDDGIDLDVPGATLTKNSADRNGDLGIEAVPGVTDGGRNKSRHNGNRLQCSNLAC